MVNIAWIAIGGALGSVLRYTMSLALPFTEAGFPKATFVSNIAASFLVGLISALIILKFPNATWLKYFVLIGFCGGFSTFSTFALELFKLNATSNFNMALVYSIASLFLGVAAVFLGFWCVKLTNPS